MRPELWPWLASLAFWACVAGMQLGAMLEARKWRQKGDRGYPQMLSAGKFYWVCRADVECMKCASRGVLARKAADDVLRLANARPPRGPYA